MADRARRRTPGPWLCAALISATAVQVAGGQTSAVTGVVRFCDTGVVTSVGGANISLVGTNISGITNDMGFYRLDNVPVGTYSVRFNAFGHLTMTAAGVVVSVGQTAVQDFHIDFHPSYGVAVTPDAPTIGVGQSHQLNASVTDCSGNVLANPFVGFSSGDPPIAAVSSSGNLTGVSPGTAVVTASSGGNSDNVTVTVVAAGDKITVFNNDGGDEAVILIDGRYETGGTTVCVNDFLQTTSSLLSLGGNMKSPSATCVSELAALSKDDAMFFETDPAKLSWTNAVGDNVSADLPNAPIGVPTVIWVHIPAGEMGVTFATLKATVGDHVTHTQAVLNDNRTGIQLSGDGPGGWPEIKNTAGVSVGTGCTDFATAEANGKRTEGYLNVYYVKEIPNRGGWYCYKYEGADVAYVGWENVDKATLTHEIGHALGLLEPGDGHSHLVDGSPTDGRNAMDPGSLALRDHLTVGQAFRMNLSEWSWINASRPSVGATVRSSWAIANALAVPPPRLCQCDPYTADGTCPRLLLDYPVWTGATVADGIPLACGAALTPSSTMSVACHTSTDLSIHLFEDVPAGPEAIGSVVWVSRDPAVVTAQADVTDPRKGQVTGEAVGSAWVVVYGGGPSVVDSVNVTVTGPC